MRKHSLNKEEFVESQDTLIPTWHGETLEKICCGEMTLLMQLLSESSNIRQSTYDWRNGTGFPRPYTLYPESVAPPMASAVQRKMRLPRGRVVLNGGILANSAIHNVSAHAQTAVSLHFLGVRLRFQQGFLAEGKYMSKLIRRIVGTASQLPKKDKNSSPKKHKL